MGSGGCVITVVPAEDLSESLSHTEVQETTPGKELREHKLKCEHSVSQKSKERLNCFHMAICIDTSSKIFRLEQKTGDAKPGLPALPQHPGGVRRVTHLSTWRHPL